MRWLQTAMRRLLRRVGPWFIPHKFYVALQRRFAVAPADMPEPGSGNGNGYVESVLISANSVLLDSHAGERCFVLCNGLPPSENLP